MAITYMLFSWCVRIALVSRSLSLLCGKREYFGAELCKLKKHAKVDRHFKAGSGSITKDSCGTNREKKSRINHCINVESPEPLIEKLPRTYIINPRWVRVEIVGGIVICEAILMRNI